ncbi:MAG: SDR family oxidoreductase [Jatrophihabitans sp.]
MLTGAGGRLGSAFCAAYVRDYDIVAVCRTRLPAVPSQFEQFVDPLDPGAALPENAGRVHVVWADLEQPGQIERVVDIALARFGRIDLLVNNAAYSRWHRPGLVEAEPALVDFDRHFAVNVGLPARLSARVAAVFWKDRAGENLAANRNIVNVSSLAASRVFPDQGQAVYAASKAALNQLTRHLGSEFASMGVRANAVAPNSFPAIVDTARVAESIVKLDRGTATGRVLVLDAEPA